MSASLVRHRRAVIVAAALAVVAALIATTLVAARGEDRPLTALPTGPMELPDDWLMHQRLSDGSTSLPPAKFAAARAEAAAVRGKAHGAFPGVLGDRWDLFGPTNIGGRVVDIAIDPEVDDQLFVAAASGGIWKSSDAADTFESVWPDEHGLGMGAVAMTSDGVLFAGTGETQPGGGSTTYAGDGLYRSHDRGESWERVGLEDTRRIGRIAIDPTDEDRIFVAASGDLFVPGDDRGVYRSTDGGDTFEQVLAGLNGTTGATEVVIDPDNPSRVYAAMWDHLRQPEGRTYGGPGSSLWRSDDGGDSWERMTNGLPGVDDHNQGRWGLALAPSNPQRLYAYTGNVIGTFRAFYRSDDGGDSWVNTGTTAGQASQSTFHWWFGKIWVDPTDEDHVFLAGVQLRRSTQAGQGGTWSTSGGIHVDQHKMAWDPDVPGRVYLGNDGGTYRSDNNGVSQSWTKSTYEPYTQFYTVDVSESDPELKVGGTQDNGCNRGYNGRLGPWNSIGCGDGLQVIIHPEDPTIVFGCSQYGSCYRSTNSGSPPRTTVTTSGRGVVWDTTRRGRNWFSPLQFDPNDPDVMYFGTTHVNRSVDNGLTWTAISDDLTGGGPDDAAGYPWGTITTLAAAPTNSDKLYVGTDDGKLWWTDDLGSNWNEVDPAQLPGTWVTRVAIHPDDENIAYATFSGFRAGSDRPHVMRTTDGGNNWVDISGVDGGKYPLPDAPVNSVVPTTDGLLIVGTDVGVFLSTWAGGEWVPLGSDLPAAPVLYLRYHEGIRELSAATFGRGIYDIRVPVCPGVRTNLPLPEPGVGVERLASCRAAQ